MRERVQAGLRLACSSRGTAAAAVLCIVFMPGVAAAAESFKIDLDINPANLHARCFEAFNDITRASERCVGPECLPLIDIALEWRKKCVCDKARAAADSDCKDRQTESESLHLIVDAIKLKLASGDSYDKRLSAMRVCADELKKFPARFACRPGECASAHDEFAAWEKRCIAGEDYVPNDNVLSQVLLVKAVLAVRKGTTEKQLVYAGIKRGAVKDETYNREAGAIWGALAAMQDKVPLPRVISGCGARCFVADVCGDHVADAASYLDRLFDCEKEQGAVTVLQMEYRDAPVANIVKHPAARVLEGTTFVVKGEKDIRDRVLFGKKAALLRDRIEQARRAFSQNNVKGALDGLVLLYRDYYAAQQGVRDAVLADLQKASGWVGDLFRFSAEQAILNLSSRQSKPDEWLGYHDKVVACPMEPLYRSTIRNADDFDNSVCLLHEMWKKAAKEFETAAAPLEKERARFKEKAEQAEFEKNKKEYDANLKKCVNATNKLLAVIRRVDACKKSACNAKTIGTIDDDRQLAQDELDAAVARLNVMLAEMVAKQVISVEKEAEIRRQGKRAGCLQLAE
ncbi:MAG: hypothetical protein HY897_19200 [Deltaproteobacteria bacterium]|nr:hypothetical protein [Deltaproteobacteria bacterium]